MLLTERTGPGRSSGVELVWRLKYFLVFVAATFGLTFGQAYAANCSITTVPDPASITVGQSVDFSGSVSGKPPITYAWTFDGGDPATSGAQNVTVTYNSTGSFEATLAGTNSSNKNQTCTASVTVTVNQNGGNQPPSAADDSYSTAQDTPLSVPAPGVLGNDSDPNNDPITVADPRTNAPTSLGAIMVDGIIAADPSRTVSVSQRHSRQPWRSGSG